MDLNKSDKNLVCPSHYARGIKRLAHRERIKASAFAFSLLVADVLTAITTTNGQVNVTQEHNASRDGVYVDAGFTVAAAAGVTRDLNFDGTISGNVYAQPLYIEGGRNGRMIIAVTESNNVYALDPNTGTIIWQRLW